MTKKELIILNASRLFQENWYDSTSIQHIIDESKVSKWCFYHHFSSKEHLFDMLAEQMATPLLSSISEIIQDKNIPFQEKILQIFKKKAEFYIHQFEAIKPLFTNEKHIILQFKARLIIKRLLKPLLQEICEQWTKGESTLTKETIALIFWMHEMLFDYILPDINLPSELQTYFDIQFWIVQALLQ